MDQIFKKTEESQSMIMCDSWTNFLPVMIAKGLEVIGVVLAQGK
jgi:hypothetical protein